MKTVQISLNSIDKVKSFVNTITKYDNDFDLVSGRYVIDAKSIMGIPKPLAPIPVFAIAIPVNFLLVRFVFKRKE